MRLYRKPTVVIYTRHSGECGKHEFDHRCDCPKFLRYSLLGKQHRVTANTRSLTHAQETAEKLQRKLDGKEAGDITPGRSLLSEESEAYLRKKVTDNVGPAAQRNLRGLLTILEDFLITRGRASMADITEKDVDDFRATWAARWAPVRRAKAQSYYRGFFKFCRRHDLLERFGKIKVPASKPSPLTVEEIEKLLKQAPVTFAGDPEKIQRVQTFIRASISLGTACIDTVSLEKKTLENVRNGVLYLERKKTGKVARPRIDENLRKELLETMNGNPRYVFWPGKHLGNVVNLWVRDIGQLFKDAGLYEKSAVTHRFRDTACDFWFGQGCSASEVADMLGDSVGVVERHYKSYVSKAREEHLAKLPARTW